MFIFSGSVFASDKVRFISVGWSGVTVKTELGIKIFESLGYSAFNMTAPVPINGKPALPAFEKYLNNMG